jgi:hypothetical protein
MADDGVVTPISAAFPPPAPQPPASPTVRTASTRYIATVYQSEEIDPNFAQTVFALERALELKQLWLLVQNGEDPEWDEVSNHVYRGFRDKKTEIARNERVGLLLHSPGGNASAAFRIIRLFQRRTHAFSTIVPLYAKSAATLMSLGGKPIIAGMDAEFGPLDVQLYDDEKEEYDSALSAVQSLERLNAYALTALDQAMQLLLLRMRKRADILLPMALQHAGGTVKPLLEKIDTIEVTRKSRELKVAEDYAVRLMSANYSPAEAKRTASNLVEQYSTHEFVIDAMEAGKREASGPRSPVQLGLDVQVANDHIEELFCKLLPHLEQDTIIGCITEREP